MNDKEQLLTKIIDSKISPLIRVANLEVNKYEEFLSLDIDDETTPYVKSEESNYLLIEEIDIRQEYKYLLDVILFDYGFDLEEFEGVVRSIDNENDITYSINHINSNERKIILKGSILGDISFLRDAVLLKQSWQLLGLKKKLLLI